MVQSYSTLCFHVLCRPTIRGAIAEMDSMIFCAVVGFLDFQILASPFPMGSTSETEKRIFRIIGFCLLVVILRVAMGVARSLL